jgi:adenosylcobinamide-phosphate synthase
MINSISNLLLSLGYKLGQSLQFVYGGLVTLFMVGLSVGLTFFILSLATEFNVLVYIVVSALILKLTFDIKEQWRNALRTKALILSRINPNNTGHFEESGLTSMAVESNDAIITLCVKDLANNASKNVVAPIFYFLFGVPWAVGYRTTSIICEKKNCNSRYRYLGKFVVKLVNILDYIPTRITALLIVVAAFFRKRTKRALDILIRDRRVMPDPNTGRPISAMAGALGVRLDISENRFVGDPQQPLTVSIIDEAIRLFKTTVVLWFLICLAIFLVLFFI